MSSKPLQTGGEVDSWCTKCKLVLNHRIVAMVGPVPKRVECSTCGSHHNFRGRAPGEKAVREGSSAPRSSRASVGPKALREAAALQAERDQTLHWEKSIAGKGVADFRAYRISERFNEGELVRHSKFGDGVITKILDAAKVEVLFKDGPKTLAQGVGA